MYIGPNGERRETSLVRKGHHVPSGRGTNAVDANRLEGTLWYTLEPDFRLIAASGWLTSACSHGVG